AAGPAAARARAERLVGEAATTAAGVLPNPQLVVEHRRTLSGPSEQETTIGIAVQLGLGGRRSLLQEAAEARRRRAQADAHATLFDAALAFREAFVTAAVDEARVTSLAEQQRALEALGVTVRGLARGGESAGYSVLRQQTQASLHRRLLTSMQARAAASRAMLEVWTGEEVTLTPIALPDLAGGAQVSAPTSLPVMATPPRIASQEAAAEASGLEARAARRRWVPDVGVSAAYRSVTGVGAPMGHGIAVGLSVPLTFFDHGQGQAALAEADRALATASAAGLKRESASLAKAATAKLHALEASVADLERAVAEAASLQSMTVTLYTAGEATLTELLDAFGAAEAARLARIDLAEEIARARLARMRAAGTLFQPALDQACGAAAGGAR
ncbi:MAG: TolC family protein, partial [Byssovorax sp.]